MKTKLRTDTSEEELFLLKIKYGTGDVAVTDICETDYKYFEKLEYYEIYSQSASITEQMKDLFDFDSFNGDVWDLILRAVPEFGVYCNWDKLRGSDWACLLRIQPQFAEHCVWGKLDGCDWSCLLRKQPQFAEHCVWDKLDGPDWAWLLQDQPQLVKYRK